MNFMFCACELNGNGKTKSKFRPPADAPQPPTATLKMHFKTLIIFRAIANLICVKILS